MQRHGLACGSSPHFEMGQDSEILRCPPHYSFAINLVLYLQNGNFENLLESIAQDGAQPSLRPRLKTDDLALYVGDCLEVMSRFPDNYVDMIFADPPYNLSNDGVTCHAGRMVKVNKGD